MTHFCNQIAGANLFDYILPLDADEFIYVDKDNFYTELASISGFGKYPWITYCPLNVNYFESDNPIFNNFARRKFEPHQYFKIIMTNEFAKKALIEFGNHSAINSFNDSGLILGNLACQHVPVRSPNQIISKAIINSNLMNLNKNRNKGECFHWDEIATFIRSKNYLLGYEDLLRIALNYSVSSNFHVENSLDKDSIKVGFSDMTWEYSDLAKTSPILFFDREIIRLITKIDSS